MTPTRSRGPALLVAAALLAVGGCRATSSPTSFAAVRTELYLGLSRPDGPEVSDAEFDAFVADDVVPRMPAGFTVVPARGHWRDASGRGVSEPSRVLVFVAPRAPDASIDAIARSYRERFHQEAVMRVDAPATASFVTTRPAVAAR
jgi:hypothetical protein